MRKRTSFVTVAAAALVASAGAAMAQTPVSKGKTYLPNFVNVEIQTLAEVVASATGKQMLLHPSVHGVVTLISEKPLSASQMYSAFAQTVVLKGYVVEESGGVVKIYPGRPGD